MKTALTKLIETVDEMINNGGDPDLLSVKVHLENSIESEKQQIIDASVQANLRYDSCANEPVILRYCHDAEQYYNRTYLSDQTTIQ